MIVPSRKWALLAALVHMVTSAPPVACPGELCLEHQQALNCTARTIHRMPSCNFRHVKGLILSHNRLTNSEFYIREDNDIKLLVVSFNELTQVRKDMFKNLHKLIYLDLSHNKINNIEDNAFGDLRNLEELYLQNNLLTDKSFFGFISDNVNVFTENNPFDSAANTIFPTERGTVSPLEENSVVIKSITPNSYKLVAILPKEDLQSIEVYSDKPPVEFFEIQQEPTEFTNHSKNDTQRTITITTTESWSLIALVIILSVALLCICAFNMVVHNIHNQLIGNLYDLLGHITGQETPRGSSDGREEASRLNYDSERATLS